MTRTPRPSSGNTVARYRFDPDRATMYRAMHDDGTYGPDRETREQAEADYMQAPQYPYFRRRTDIEPTGRQAWAVYTVERPDGFEVSVWRGQHPAHDNHGTPLVAHRDTKEDADRFHNATVEVIEAMHGMTKEVTR